MDNEAVSRAIEAASARLEGLRGHSWYQIALETRTAFGWLAGKTTLSPGDILEKFALKIPVGVNTLRRYLAASEFAEQSIFGNANPKSTDLAFVEENFTGIETISRLNKIDPSKTSDHIAGLKRGAVTTRYLRDKLKTARNKDPSSSTARRGQATARRIESRKGLEEELVLFLRSLFANGGRLYRGTKLSYIRASWFATVGGNEFGYFVASADSRQTIEEAIFSASFGSRFFMKSWLVVPSPSKENIDHAQHLIDAAKLKLGLLTYDRRIEPIRDAAPRQPRRASIVGTLVDEW
jgi:hypothetical protein